MRIDDDFELHKGAFANIRLASNVGAVNRVVELTEGDPTLPELARRGRAERQADRQSGRLRSRGLDPDPEGARRHQEGPDRPRRVAVKPRAPTSTGRCATARSTLNETANLLGAGQRGRRGAADARLPGADGRLGARLEPGGPRRGGRPDRPAAAGHTAQRQAELAETTQAARPGAGQRPASCSSAPRTAVPHLRDARRSRRAAGRRARPLRRPGRARDPGGAAVPLGDEEAGPLDARRQLRKQRRFLQLAPPVSAGSTRC